MSLAHSCYEDERDNGYQAFSWCRGNSWCILVCTVGYLLIIIKREKPASVWIVVAQTQNISWRNHKTLITLVVFGEETGCLGQQRRKTILFNFWYLPNFEACQCIYYFKSKFKNFSTFYYEKFQMYREIEGILLNTRYPLQRITLSILLD